jgi:acyl carrier protein
VATIFERVQEVVAEKLSVDESEVVLEASFTEDLNADSLDLVELIMAFEEEFSTDDMDLEISDEDAENILTVEQAVEFLKSNGITDD